MYKLINTINNLKINNTGYELNKATTTYSQGGLKSDPDTITHMINGPDTVTHTSNRILDENLLSCRTIGRVSASPPPENPISMTPQTLITPAVNKIFTDVTSINACTSRTQW